MYRLSLLYSTLPLACTDYHYSILPLAARGTFSWPDGLGTQPPSFLMPRFLSFPSFSFLSVPLLGLFILTSPFQKFILDSIMLFSESWPAIYPSKRLHGLCTLQIFLLLFFLRIGVCVCVAEAHLHGRVPFTSKDKQHSNMALYKSSGLFNH